MKAPAQTLLLVLSLAAAAPSARADLGFPATVKFPAQIVIDPDQALVKEDLAEVEFETDAKGTIVAKRGQHFARWFHYKPAAGEPAPGYYNGTEGRMFKAVQTALSSAGWTLVYTAEGNSPSVFKLASGGGETWLRMKMDAPQAQVNFEAIQIGTVASALVHTPPAATPEKFTDKDKIPYLTPYPGATLQDGSGHTDGALDVSLAFSNGGANNEGVLVGTGVVSRFYQGPTTLSSLQFTSENREALVKAGWTVLYPKTAREDGANGALIAHYTKNGRDIWARIAYLHGASLSYQVADVGAEDWAAKLAKECRVPLYGVFFDFNKAILKPESDPVLNKAAAVLKSASGFNVEVQGHTDSVGGDDANLKLSEARAASVMQWLTAHGIPAARLTSKGYGKTQPVADNKTDEGRAKNRRVELRKAGCGK